MSYRRTGSLSAAAVLFGVITALEFGAGANLIALGAMIMGLDLPLRNKTKWSRRQRSEYDINLALVVFILILGILAVIAARGIWNARRYGWKLGLVLGIVEVVLFSAILLFIPLFGLMLVTTPDTILFGILLATSVIGFTLIIMSWKGFEGFTRTRTNFCIHLGVYLLVNPLLVGIWWVTEGVNAFPWFIYPLFGWGIVVVEHLIDVCKSSASEKITNEALSSFLAC
jgi:hypothetical protein